MFWNIEHSVWKPWTSDLMLAAEATCHLSNWNLEQVCQPWTCMDQWPVPMVFKVYRSVNLEHVWTNDQCRWCSRFTVSKIEISCKALTLVLAPGHKIYWACSVEMFEVYICLFKVYRGVQGVKGSFTFTLTVFEVEIASRTCWAVSSQLKTSRSQFLDRYACAISDAYFEEVIITGGHLTGNNAMKTVSVYSEAGWQRDLTPLNQGRFNHACSSYVNGGKKVKNTLWLW